MNPYKPILAIDPGGTTGMAVRISPEIIQTFTCSEPEEVFDFVTQNKDILLQIVIENFAAELIGKWGLFTVRIVGGVYALCHQYEIPYKLHQPQDRYPFQIEARDFLKPRKTVIHEQDALAHLFRWEYDNKIG